MVTAFNVAPVFLPADSGAEDGADRTKDVVTVICGPKNESVNIDDAGEYCQKTGSSAALQHSSQPQRN
jgi:hypothetical protein